MYRTKDFDEHLSKQLKDPAYRKEYLQELISPSDLEEGLEPIEAIKSIIAAMGVTEFSKLCKMERSSVSRILYQESMPRVETLNKMLAPFKFKIRLELEEVA